MSLLARLNRLEQALQPRGTQLGPPCERCGAPESVIYQRGMIFIIVPDETNEPKCKACGRWLDEDSGYPIEADTAMVLIRATPPV